MMGIFVLLTIKTAWLRIYDWINLVAIAIRMATFALASPEQGCVARPMALRIHAS